MLRTCCLLQVEKDSWPLRLQNSQKTSVMCSSVPSWPICISTKHFSVSESGCHIPLASLSPEREEIAPRFWQPDSTITFVTLSPGFRDILKLYREDGEGADIVLGRCQGECHRKARLALTCSNPCLQILENGLVIWRVSENILMLK